jgi:nucleoside-diphosphate-sugar epimerase
MLNLSEVESLLITGANGFVGRSVVEKISDLEPENLPKQIVLITRNGIDYEMPERISGKTKFATHNLTKPWLFDFKPTHIINLAADGSRHPYSEEANLIFTTIGKNLVEWVSSIGIKPRVFHASSGACFGYKPLNSLQEIDNSKSAFINSRIEVENLLKSRRDSDAFDLVIGRLFTFSGKNLLDKNQYAITDFVKSAVDHGKIQVKGNPDTIRSFMHQEAMAHWILQSLISTDCPIDLQIGSSEQVKIGELAEYVGRETNAQVEYSKNFQGGDVYLPDNASTKTKLGVTEGLPWKRAVRQMIEILRMEKNVRR